LKRYTYKVVFLGDAEVGKTSIVARHSTSFFTEKYMPSIGANITSRDYNIDGKDVTLMIWDIAAQEGFSRVRYDYYQGARAAFIVYDVTRPWTFDDIVFWLDDLKKSVRRKIPILLVGNKIDLPPVVLTSSGHRLADDLGADFIETSAKTGQNIEAAFDRIARKLLEASSTKLE
jgi:small GTP-binding protein